ncbi:protein sorting-associated protein 60 [Seminavis robusta]|uniref:Protein sorting-associated protein 60 n=1 Tax=Seminavis robusta TaxID=568900 RepID=A0A9N8EB22_9STRA|nr:protein sorting-associated protein 60 [Seminavis robusta]|eukprot:Sro752_g197130.1 protein sorting-associated protein 60 (224) ;mRNA; f:8686-9357
MNRVFGKKKATAPAPTLVDASVGLGGRIGGMDTKIQGLDDELRQYKEKIKKARTPAAKKQLQKRAMEVLKRKKMYEQQRDMACGQQFNIDQAQFGMESAKATVQTVAAMKSANHEMKKVMKKDLNIDAVEDLADDMADMFYEFNEINEALGNNYATPDLDEADLDAELEMLGDELEMEELEAETTPSYLQAPLPSQPTDVPGNKLPANGELVDEFGLPAAPAR